MLAAVTNSDNLFVMSFLIKEVKVQKVEVYIVLI